MGHENGSHASQERRPLLDKRDDSSPSVYQSEYQATHHRSTSNPSTVSSILVEFREDDDPDDPRQWSARRKNLNVLIIAMMAILSPLASSLFTPGISQIAHDLHTSVTAVVGATTGFVICLGVGPMLLAPLSETFGRRPLYLICFTIFSLLQIPTALSPNVTCLNTMRALAGLFGSVAVANGGGSLNDMFVPEARAGIFGWYLLGPLLGPVIGPIAGGLIVEYLHWRWLFWILAIICTINTLAAFFFLRESYAPVILERRKRALVASASHKPDPPHYHTSADSNVSSTTSLPRRLRHRLQTPLRILFSQPIVATMAVYQSLLYATTYTLWTNFEAIYTSRYAFSPTQVGLVNLGPGLGFILAARLLVPRIDTIYNYLTEKRDPKGESRPEYRLPLACVGAVGVPIALFGYGWAVEWKLHWLVGIAATVVFAAGQVTIQNTVQNYYIDCFDRYAASAIAAGALFRAIVGGLAPLGAPAVFDRFGYGWGFSFVGGIALVLAPAPWLFMRFGKQLRDRFAVDLD